MSKKISQLDDAAALTGDEYLEVSQSGVSKKTTVTEVIDRADDLEIPTSAILASASTYTNTGDVDLRSRLNVHLVSAGIHSDDIDYTESLIGRFADRWVTASIIPSGDSIGSVDFPVTVFKNRIWSGGGRFLENDWSTTYYTRNVYSSKDGNSWTLEGKIPDKRFAHSFITFDDKLWLLGGQEPTFDWYTSIYNSTNGRDWNLVSNNIPPSGVGLKSFGMCVHNNSIFIAGGQRAPQGDISTNQRKILKSQDGITWTQTGTIPAYPDPGSLKNTGLVSWKNRLFLVGGTDGNSDPSDRVYVSDDEGATWTLHGTMPAPRAGHYTLIYDGKLFVIAGTPNNYTAQDSVFYSEDGINWNTGNTLPDKLYTDNQTNAIVYDGKMMIFSGISDADPYGVNNAYHSFVYEPINVSAASIEADRKIQYQIDNSFPTTLYRTDETSAARATTQGTLKIADGIRVGDGNEIFQGGEVANLNDLVLTSTNSIHLSAGQSGAGAAGKMHITIDGSGTTDLIQIGSVEDINFLKFSIFDSEGLHYESEIRTSEFQIYDRNTGYIMFEAKDGGVSLMQAGTGAPLQPRLKTIVNGIQLTAPSINGPALVKMRQTPGRYGNFEIVSQAPHGRGISLISEDTSGVEQLLFTGSPDTSAALYFAGIKTFETIEDGIQLQNRLNETADIFIGREVANLNDLVLSTTNSIHLSAGDIYIPGTSSSVILYIGKQAVTAGRIDLKGGSASSPYIKLNIADEDATATTDWTIEPSSDNLSIGNNVRGNYLTLYTGGTGDEFGSYVRFETTLTADVAKEIFNDPIKSGIEIRQSRSGGGVNDYAHLYVGYETGIKGDLIIQTLNSIHLSAGLGSIEISGGAILARNIKSGPSQVGAGAIDNEIWKTDSHATLPDNVLMIGI